MIIIAAYDGADGSVFRSAGDGGVEHHTVFYDAVTITCDGADVVAAGDGGVEYHTVFYDAVIITCDGADVVAAGDGGVEYHTVFYGAVIITCDGADFVAAGDGGVAEGDVLHRAIEVPEEADMVVVGPIDGEVADGVAATVEGAAEVIDRAEVGHAAHIDVGAELEVFVTEAVAAVGLGREEEEPFGGGDDVGVLSGAVGAIGDAPEVDQVGGADGDILAGQGEGVGVGAAAEGAGRGREAVVGVAQLPAGDGVDEVEADGGTGRGIERVAAEDGAAVELQAAVGIGGGGGAARGKGDAGAGNDGVEVVLRVAADGAVAVVAVGDGAAADHGAGEAAAGDDGAEGEAAADSGMAVLSHHAAIVVGSAADCGGGGAAHDGGGGIGTIVIAHDAAVIPGAISATIDGDGGGGVAVLDGAVIILAHDAAHILATRDAAVADGDVPHRAATDVAEEAFVVVARTDADAADGVAAAVEGTAEASAAGADGGVVAALCAFGVVPLGGIAVGDIGTEL